MQPQNASQISPVLPRTASAATAINSTELTEVLESLGLAVEGLEVEPGLRVSLAHFKLLGSARLRDAKAVADDVMLRLGVTSVRVRTGLKRGHVTMELAHDSEAQVRVSLGDVLLGGDGGDRALPWAVGLQANGTPVLVDLAEAPHALVGGQTGSGKSSHLHSLVLSLATLRRPEELELVLVDPKQVDLYPFRALPHVRRPVAKTVSDVRRLVSDLATEVEFRFQEFRQAGVPDIKAYNVWAAATEGEAPLWRIVVVVDELTMVFAGKEGAEVAESLTALAQVCRAAGVHLVLSTQRPSAQLIPTQLRSQLTTRVACRVATATDSRMLLDASGAEKLLGSGDSLVSWAGKEPVRVQGVLVTETWRTYLVELLAFFARESAKSTLAEAAAVKGKTTRTRRSSRSKQSKQVETESLPSLWWTALLAAGLLAWVML
jgi:DNA segregation ATPase FtsK/SpoIIIE, S-DNA-T family